MAFLYDSMDWRMFSSRTAQLMGVEVPSSTKYRGIVLLAIWMPRLAAKEVELTPFGPSMLCDCIMLPAGCWMFLRLLRAGEALYIESIDATVERPLETAESFLSGRDPCDEIINDSLSASDAEPSYSSSSFSKPRSIISRGGRV